MYINDKVVPYAKPGENVNVKLGKGVNEEDLHKGYVLSSVVDPIRAVTSFEATLVLLDLGGRALLTAGYSCVIHIHTCEEECTLEEVRGRRRRREGGAAVWLIVVRAAAGGD